MNKKTFALLCLLFGIAFSYFLAHTFQHPVYVSKVVIAIALAVGFGSVSLMYFVNLRTAEKIILNTSTINRTLLISMILGVAYLMMVGYSPSTLLAPRQQVSITLQADGKPGVALATLTGISDGLRYHPLASVLRARSGNLVVIDGKGKIISGTAGSAELTVSLPSRGERLYFFFENSAPNLKVHFLHQGQKSTFNSSAGQQEDSFSTSIELGQKTANAVFSWLLFFISIVLTFTFLSVKFHLSDLKPNNWLAKTAIGINIAFIIIAVVYYLFQYSPKFVLPNIDSYTFNFFGREVLYGKIPYKDMWDNKSPLIFYINALGQSFQMGTWGVWFIEAVFILFSSILLYKVAGKKAGIFWPAALVIFLGALTRRSEGGNMAEEYAVLFYMSAFFLYWKFLHQPDHWLLSFLIGAAAGASIMLRASMVSAFLAVGFFMLLENLLKKKYKNSLYTFLFLLLGLLTVVGIFFAYFAFKSALPDFIDQAFVYNFFYSQKAVNPLLERASLVIRYYPLHMVLIFCCFSVVLLSAMIKKEWYSELERKFMFSFTLGFVVEILIHNLSGNGYPHYTVTLIPYEGLILAFFGYLLIKMISGSKWVFNLQHTPLTFVLILSIGFLANTRNLTAQNTIVDMKRVESLKSFLKPGDKLLMWGYATDFYYELNVEPASRYNYHLGFNVCEYINEDKVNELIQDIDENKPVIVDAYTLGEAYYLNQRIRKPGAACPPVKAFFDYVSANYQKVGQLSNGYEVYQPITDH